MPSPTTRSNDPAATETPLHFESGDRPLYAVFHAAQRPRPAAPVLVQCHSVGVEQLTNYRNEVLLARAAAAAGIPVLRYHARGHGDSAGDFSDVTVERLIEDAQAAADEARSRSGAGRVAWLGVRFGGLAAAGAIARRDDGAALVLWEPVLRPADYFRAQLRGLLFSRVAHGRRPDSSVEEMLATIERESRVDVHGYYLHRALVDSARDLDLAAALSGWAGPTLLVQIQSRPRLTPGHAALAKALETRGASVRTLVAAEEPGWHFMANPAWQSTAVIAPTLEWLDAVA